MRKFVATYFNLGDVLNGLTTIVVTWSVSIDTSHKNVQNDNFHLSLKDDVLFDPVSVQRRQFALHNAKAK